MRAFLNVSLGRMRFVMGPLSWLAHAPMLGRLPFTPALGTAAGALSVAATSAVAGILPAPPTATPAPRTAAPAAIGAPAPHSAVRSTPPSAHRVLLHRRPAVVPVHASSAAPRQALTPTPGPVLAPAPPVRDPAPAPAADPPAPPPAADPPPAPPAPRFAGGGDVSVAEDSPAASLSWATAIDAGAAGAGVTFATTSFGPDLFAVQPFISPAGVLTFTPAKDANGETTVVTTAGSPTGLSAPRSFHLTVLPVDDAPSFVGAGDVTAVEGAGPTSVAWASRISPGPGNEAGQHVRFTAATKDTALFAPGGWPVVDDRGTLTFTPASFAHGTAEVQVTATDDGGVANGGIDRTTATFSLTVLPRNHGPVVSGVGDVSVLEDAGPQIVQWVTSSSPGAPDESAQTVELSATNDHPELFAVQPQLSQSGLLTFTPAAEVNGTATVS